MVEGGYNYQDLGERQSISQLGVGGGVVCILILFSLAFFPDSDTLLLGSHLNSASFYPKDISDSSLI